MNRTNTFTNTASSNNRFLSTTSNVVAETIRFVKRY